MVRIENYLKRQWIELLYALILYLCTVLAILLKEYIFVVAATGLYFISILIEYIRFSVSKEVPLKIETPDGYNEPYHPSVLFFENGWHGYRYWMAFTPMPLKASHNPYTDRWECPCVYASNDGKTFVSPENLVGGGIY